MDKSWVWLPRASVEYEEGARAFVFASAKTLGNPLQMFCPCMDCQNVCHQDINTVVDHLVIRSMDQKYKRSACWSFHGDIRSEKTVDEKYGDLEAYELFRSAFFDNEDNTQFSNKNGEPPEVFEEESKFKKKLEDAETPLYSSCPNYTKVAAIMGLYRIKVKSGISENSFDQILTMVHDMLPEGIVLPKSTAEIKKFLKVFGFGYEVIHACKNDCILYRKQYEEMSSCLRCGASRWELDKHFGETKNGIPAKVHRYFPIKDRFQRMFRSKITSKNLQWHFSNASEDGTMRHPVDSLTRMQVNAKWPQFAADPRNLRLGISTDGMNPFSIQNTKYSTWPVMLVTYNMPPTMCMKSENIMATLLIPGPTAPSNNIDVYLAPLIDDLIDLWNEGIHIYDSLSQENFTLRAILLWSISDYPGLGTLSGCKVKGKQACNVCGKDTPYKWLNFSRKHFYLGNRKRLRPGHPYRRRRVWFDNTVEEGTANRIQTGAEIFELLKDFKNEFGDLCKGGPRFQILDWCSSDDVVIGEGELCSAEPTYKIGRIPLGPNAAAIFVKSVIDEEASVWRPTSTVTTIGQAVGLKIAWQFDKIILDEMDSSAINKTFDSSATDAKEDKILIYNWLKDDEVISEGRLRSTDPKTLVNNIPLGPNAAIVKIDRVLNKDGSLWRPNEEMVVIVDVLGENIAWPIHKISMANIQASPGISKSRSPGSFSHSSNTSKNEKRKCMLIDCKGSGKMVAEGRVFSTNPEDVVHHVPLGPNASKVLVDVPTIEDAPLWRTNSELKIIDDALGSIVAWPNDKLVYFE